MKLSCPEIGEKKLRAAGACLFGTVVPERARRKAKRTNTNKQSQSNDCSVLDGARLPCAPNRFRRWKKSRVESVGAQDHKGPPRPCTAPPRRSRMIRVKKGGGNKSGTKPASQTNKRTNERANERTKERNETGKKGSSNAVSPINPSLARDCIAARDTRSPGESGTSRAARACTLGPLLASRMCMLAGSRRSQRSSYARISREQSFIAVVLYCFRKESFS